jgi:hypothetical protein
MMQHMMLYALASIATVVKYILIYQSISDNYLPLGYNLQLWVILKNDYQ